MSQQITLDKDLTSPTKSVSNSLLTLTESKKKQFLRKKRNLELIERNYLIRRFYYPIRQTNEYEIESKTYSILNHFDLESPLYNKFSSINNISANAFWFLMCSFYFPYYSNELIDQKECIPEELKKLIDYIDTNNNKKNSNYGDKCNFTIIKCLLEFYAKKKNNNLKEKNNLFQTTNIETNKNTNDIYNSKSTTNLNDNKTIFNLSNLSCTNNISSIKCLLQNLIKYLENKNENYFLSKIKNDYLLTRNYNRDIRVEEDFELDMKFHTKNYSRFREEILINQEESDEEDNDDAVCSVCGDGEYEDDNLILFCSKCNMAIHQKCYGVLIIPDGDWICHLCKSFKDINYCKNMECILCPNLGGAMKPCTLRKSSHSYKVMIKNRKNPFLKDNFNKIYNLNNSISEDNKDNKNAFENKINNVLKNEKSLYTIPESILSNSDNNQNIMTPPPVDSIMKIVNNNINMNKKNDLNSLNNINSLQTNSLNNNYYNDNNINILQNNQLEISCRSSNINKDTDSIISNSSSNKINTKEENDNLNNNINPINNSFNKILKKQIQKIKIQSEIYLSEKIAYENAWVHLSCALWLPELNITNFELKEKIKGIENIPKKRLLEECNICLKMGYGPTIKCQKCDYHFHPECARKLKNFFLEINENENGDTTFLAYCNKDAPPHHLKRFELIKQRKRDDIKKFSSLLQKDISSLNKLSDDKQYNIFHPYCYNPNNNEMKKIIEDEKKIIKKIGKNNNNINENDNNTNNNEIPSNDSTKKSTNSNIYNFEKDIELTSSEKKCLLNTIREMLIDESNLTLEINSENYSIRTNDKITITYEDLQYPEKFSWCFLKENQYYLNGITNYETFKIFQGLIPNKEEYIKNILKEKIISPEKQKKNKNKNKIKTDKFCICNKISEKNEYWVGCESDRKCPGNGWYHLKCIPELKDYNMNSFDNHFEHYYCPKCREKYNLKNVIKKGMEINESNIDLNPQRNINGIKGNDIGKKNNIELDLKKIEGNPIENSKIIIQKNFEEKHNKSKIKKTEFPMEIEEDIKEEKTENNSNKIN